MSIFARLASSAVCLVALAVPASAAEELVINVDQTQILKTAAKPGTIIIGSPGIVDASMQGGNILLQGKSYGSTNIIILDRKGAEMLSFNVTVKTSGTNNVAVYKAGERFTYSCTPACETAAQVGDNSNFLFTTLSASSAKQEFLMRSTSTESQPSNGGNTNSSEN